MPNYEITMDVEDSGSGTIVDPTQLNDAGNAKRAEAWAVGQRNGVDVPSTDPTYHNNSKYYAQQAGSSAGSASSSADAAAAAAQHYPYVDSTSGNWMVWDTSTGAFVDTGVHAQGPTGPTGPGVPSGGTAGQVLKKVNGTDYNAEWANNDGTTIPMSSSDSTSINEAITNVEQVKKTTTGISSFTFSSESDFKTKIQTLANTLSANETRFVVAYSNTTTAPFKNYTNYSGFIYVNNVSSGTANYFSTNLVNNKGDYLFCYREGGDVTVSSISDQIESKAYTTPSNNSTSLSTWGTLPSGITTNSYTRAFLRNGVRVVTLYLTFSSTVSAWSTVATLTDDKLLPKLNDTSTIVIVDGSSELTLGFLAKNTGVITLSKSIASGKSIVMTFVY